MKSRNRKRLAAYISFMLSALFASALLFDVNGPHQFWRSVYGTWRATIGEGGVAIVLLLGLGSAAFAAGAGYHPKGSTVLFVRAGRSESATVVSGRADRGNAQLRPLFSCVAILRHSAQQLGSFFERIHDVLGIRRVENWRDGCERHDGLCLVRSDISARAWLFPVLTRRLERSTRELHCRKCDYILRGLSEPRCPECGESI